MSVNQTKKLFRDTDGALLGGVMSGLANYFHQDPILFRLVCIGLLLITGVFPGIFLYLIAWFFIPTRPKADYDISS
jgi:phage shock protein C